MATTPGCEIFSRQKFHAATYPARQKFQHAKFLRGKNSRRRGFHPGKNSRQLNFHDAKIPCAKISVRQKSPSSDHSSRKNFRAAKIPDGENSTRQKFRCVKFPCDEFSVLWKNRRQNFPLWNFLQALLLHTDVRIIGIVFITCKCIAKEYSIWIPPLPKFIESIAVSESHRTSTW